MFEVSNGHCDVIIQSGFMGLWESIRHGKSKWAERILHHSIFHGNWDGYTDYSQEGAYAVRRSKGVNPPEPYLGTLANLTQKMLLLNPDMKSACANDEHDKNALPDFVCYDTCSSFANHGEVGIREGDAISSSKGVNDYILVGNWKGIKRRWLAHYQITIPDRTTAAKKESHLIDSH